MNTFATEGRCLSDLIRLAKPLCIAAEMQSARQGPGRPLLFANWLLALLIMIAVLKKKKSKSAQYRFIDSHRKQLTRAIGVNALPSRTTYFERYKQAHRLFEIAIRLQGQAALKEKIIDAAVVSVDKSMIAAQGPRWHQCHRKKNVLPEGFRGIDRESGWGVSGHDGWVQGYSYEIAVTATKNSLVFPLLASAHTAAARETLCFKDKAEYLPDQTRDVLTDSAYDSNDCAEAVELDEQGHRSGRHFLCPPNPRNPSKGEPRDKRRRIHRHRRQRRLRHFRTKKAQRLYKRRCQSVEPANEWFKELFELTEHVWHRGLANNQTQLLAAIFSYQVLIRLNHRKGNKNGQVKWIMDYL